MYKWLVCLFGHDWQHEASKTSRANMAGVDTCAANVLIMQSCSKCKERRAIYKAMSIKDGLIIREVPLEIAAVALQDKESDDVKV